MRITRVEAWPVTFDLAQPYAIAYQDVEQATNVFLRLETDGPLVGCGCAAPDPDVTGEEPEATLKALLEIAAPLLEGSDPTRVVFQLERLREPFAGLPAAMAAVDMALLDLVARKADLPLWKLLGGFRPSIATSATVGILPLPETVAAARRLAKLGFRAVKLKGGREVESDIARVHAVRAALGAGMALRFDANQGYTLEEAHAFVEATRPCKLELLEQPTPADQPEALGRLAASGLPIMADESLLSLRDAFRLARGRLVDMVNLKLMKVGGLTEALRVAAVARAGGLAIMVGCMDEAALAIAAGLAFALARPGVRYADLDGHFDLVGDPTAAAVRFDNGLLYPADEPGLGVRV
ncbi:MAG: mandelate racemase/muconate lactonizing enzyme family protein [Thermoanaerobaculia bacterium]